MTEFEALVAQKKREHGCDPDLIDVVEDKEYGQYAKLACRQCKGETFVWRGPEGSQPAARARRNPHRHY